MPVPAEQLLEGVSHAPAVQRWRLTVTGRVQGVGFRPFVYRLATRLRLAGTVRNSPAGVTIDIQGELEQLSLFRQRLSDEHPLQAKIDRIAVRQLALGHLRGFNIASSAEGHESRSTVTPDLALCTDCRREVGDPSDRRYRYPFTNCTNCGPRYTIIEGLPYDRERTSMRGFSMCAACEAEYHDPLNRRFHAQPNACPVCGPQLSLLRPDGRQVTRGNDALLQTAAAIREGLIVALKGLGGYQLLVDARSEPAVRRLRHRKARPEKPFALMYPALDMVKRHGRVTPNAERWLGSAAAPIVLLPRGDGSQEGVQALAPSVAPGLDLLGVMLPYTPLHLLLLEDLGFPVVATSGNQSGDPICVDDLEALQRLGPIADLFLAHDRPIVRAVDDSVVRPMEDHAIIIRLARGLAPAVVPLTTSVSPMLAVGGHMKNAFALAAEDRIVLSEHMGDLDSPRTRRHVRASLDALPRLLGVTPGEVSYDMHPDYASTVQAQSLGLKVRPIQHHVAHIATAVAEHDLHGPVVGFAWDGTGLGEDGTIWGGETFLIDDDSYARAAHIRPFRLPGGEQAVRDPRRAAVGVLHERSGTSFKSRWPAHLESSFAASELAVLDRMLCRQVNCPRTSSVGRLFDAVAALLGVFCRKSTFEGQAAMALETAAARSQDIDPFPFALSDGQPLQIDWGPMIGDSVVGFQLGDNISALARRFHATLAEMIASVATRFEQSVVVLGGGCFQNTTLLDLCRKRLTRDGRTAYWPERVPLNDGGLAVGQALVATRGLTRRG